MRDTGSDLIAQTCNAGLHVAGSQRWRWLRRDLLSLDPWWVRRDLAPLEDDLLSPATEPQVDASSLEHLPGMPRCPVVPAVG